MRGRRACVTIKVMDVMKPLKRIAAVNDMSCLGKCSLTVALPIVSASGVECACLPTALLSTHTGEFTGWTWKDLSDELLPVAEHWRAVGAKFDGVYTGYLASPEQEKLVERVIDRISDENTLLIVDPAMADNGRYYAGFDDSMRDAFRDLCRRADVITPNVTEAALLTGLPYVDGPHPPDYVDALLRGLAGLCRGVVSITGVCPDKGLVGVVALDTGTGEGCVDSYRLSPGMFHGAGDIFASAFTALLVRGAELKDALDTAISLVWESIERTAQRGAPTRFGMDFEGALPAYMERVRAIFG